MRMSYNGITLAFQANDAGSIPVIRSNKNSAKISVVFCYQGLEYWGG
jgi:hypothetical protein